MLCIADVLESRAEKVQPQDYPDLPFIGLDDVEAHTMRLIGSKQSSKLKSTAKRFYIGDVLYSRLRPYLNKVWLADREGICSSEFIVLAGNKFVDPKFMTLRLNASDFVSFANSLNSGDRPRVDFDQISSFSIPPIALIQQRRIVAKIEALFSELDNGVAALKTAREQLKVYRQTVLKHVFEGKLTAKWRREHQDELETPQALLARIQKEREARYQQKLKGWQQAIEVWEAIDKKGKKPSKPKKLAVLKDPSSVQRVELPKLPYGWLYVRLGSLIDEPTYGTSKKCAYDLGDKGVLRIPNISNGSIDPSNLKFATFDEDEVKKFALQEGDLLTIRSNGSVSLVGNCALISEKDADFLFAGYLIRLRPNQKLAAPAYLLSGFASHLMRKQIENVAKSTSGVNNINTGEIQNLLFPLPPLAEQLELLKFLAVSNPLIDVTEKEIDAQLAKAETLRQSILKKAFSGQLVPQEPSDEPAAELLARIQAEKAAQTRTKRGRKTSESKEA